MNPIELNTQAVRTTHNCPKCKNPETERIPRGPLLKTLAPWLAVKHYVCYKCGNKFYSKH